MSTPQQRGGLVLQVLPPRLPVQSSLVAWFDAAQINGNSGGVVPQWLDASGNGNHVAQATGAAQPTYQVGMLNGLPLLAFSGAQVLYGSDSGMPTGDLSIFTVSRSNTSAPQVILSYGTDVNTKLVQMMYEFSGLTFTQRGDSIAIASSTGAYYIASGTRSGSTYTLYRNGGSSTTKSMTTATTLAGANALAIGVQTGAGKTNYLIGWIGEIVVFSSALSTADRQTMERYLSNKWGIALS